MVALWPVTFHNHLVSGVAIYKNDVIVELVQRGGSSGTVYAAESDSLVSFYNQFLLQKPECLPPPVKGR